MADIGETAPSSAVEADGGASLCANWSIGQLGPGPVSSALQHTGTGRLNGRQTIIGSTGLPSGGAVEALKGCPMPLGYKKGEGVRLENESGPWVRNVEKKNKNLSQLGLVNIHDETDMVRLAKEGELSVIEPEFAYLGKETRDEVTGYKNKPVVMRKAALIQSGLGPLLGIVQVLP